MTALQLHSTLTHTEQGEEANCPLRPQWCGVYAMRGAHLFFTLWMTYVALSKLYVNLDLEAEVFRDNVEKKFIRSKYPQSVHSENNQYPNCICKELWV